MVILLVITFPVWISIGAVLFGAVAGIFGAIIGVFGTVFGVLMAMVALPFKLLFGWPHGGWHWFPHFHFNTCMMIAAIIIVALVIKNRK